MCFLYSAESQNVDVKIGIGSTFYQGDLSPSSGPLSFSPGQLSWSVQAGLKVNNLFKPYLNFLVGRIAAKDADANTDGRISRNLSFDSPIWEVGIGSEININYFIPALDKSGLSIFLTGGVNFFSFKPKAIYNGQIVDLQPLGTEGQGLQGYDKHYSLTQINIMGGIGIKFPITSRLDLGFEVVPRITFTDYLDDVSGNYVPRDVFLAADKEQAAIMSNRTGEWLGTDAIEYPLGTPRGNPDDNDRFMFSSISLTLNFGDKSKLIPVKTKKDLLLDEGNN